MLNFFKNVASWLLKPVGAVMLHHWSLTLIVMVFVYLMNQAMLYVASKHDAPPPRVDTSVADSLRAENTQLLAERELYRAELQTIQTQKIQSHAQLKNIQDSLARRSNADVYANW